MPTMENRPASLSEIPYLSRAMKTGVIAEVLENLAELARTNAWSYEEYLAAVMDRAPRELISHLATSTFVAKADNVILLGPPGVGKTHLAVGLGIKACHNGYSVYFDTAIGWLHRLTEADSQGRLAAELKRIRKYKLIIIDLCRARDYAEAIRGRLVNRVRALGFLVGAGVLVSA
ncbi:UNVERIFIED_ORG: chromosomal replication initiation ATPase DnaA [Arthrobacter sp. UYCu721]